jgi:hypothetical protein
MLFNDAFFEQLHRESIPKALKEFCNVFLEFDRHIDQEVEYDSYDLYIDGYAAIESFIVVNELQEEFPIPKLSGNVGQQISVIRQYYYDVNNKTDETIAKDLLESSRTRYRVHLNGVFSYHFTGDEISRIQELINELRDLLRNSESFEDKHKERLIDRLEKFQKELNRKMSSLDRFWGFIGDLGVVLGKFGTDVKPLVDRYKEIVEIGWKAQAKAEELPDSTSIPKIDSEI